MAILDFIGKIILETENVEYPLPCTRCNHAVGSKKITNVVERGRKYYGPGFYETHITTGDFYICNRCTKIMAIQNILSGLIFGLGLFPIGVVLGLILCAAFKIGGIFKVSIMVIGGAFVFYYCTIEFGRWIMMQYRVYLWVLNRSLKTRLIGGLIAFGILMLVSLGLFFWIVIISMRS